MRHGGLCEVRPGESRGLSLLRELRCRARRDFVSRGAQDGHRAVLRRVRLDRDGRAVDLESTRRVMSRYFEAMRTAIESHGGTVEKFIGDAVMAVFGIPVVHEDDALRAVRAAADMLGPRRAERGARARLGRPDREPDRRQHGRGRRLRRRLACDRRRRERRRAARTGSRAG